MCDYSGAFGASKLRIPGPAVLRLCLGILIAASLCASTAQAQRYKTIPPRLTTKQAKALRLTVAQAMRDPVIFAAQKDKVDQYFKQYYFPTMTLTTGEALGALGKKREDLFRRYIRAATDPATQAHLTDLTLKVAQVLCKDNYHHAVRYNAVLILGMLDEQYSVGVANPTQPVPLPAGTVALLELLEQEDFKGVKVHPSVLTGALVGLERHARFGIDSKYAQRLTKVALDTIAEEKLPDDVTKDIHHWMKCRAASVLAYQVQERPTAEVQQTLAKLIANADFDLEDRCCVALLLKTIDYAQVVNIDATDTVAALGQLANEVLKEGADSARDYQQEMLGGNVNFGRRNRPGRFGAEDDGPKYERRQLLSRLESINDGGRSLIAGLADDTKTQLENLLEAIKQVRLSAKDKNLGDLELAELVIETAGAVSREVKSWNPAAAPADVPDADFS